MWEKLNDTKIKNISRGGFFRCPGKPPYEKIVDFMIIENSESPSGLSLMVASGYKAGITLLNFPKESLTKVFEFPVLSIDWLKQNWNKWIYELGPNGVYVLEKYEINEDWNRLFR